MNILALDLATTTGYAYDLEDVVAWGHESFMPAKKEPKGMRFTRYLSWIRNMMDNLEPDLIAYEKPHRCGGDATKVLEGMVWAMESEASMRDIPVKSVRAAELKKFATGNGRASKEDMISTAKEHYKIDSNITDDEADALWILAWAKNKFGK